MCFVPHPHPLPRPSPSVCAVIMAARFACARHSFLMALCTRKKTQPCRQPSPPPFKKEIQPRVSPVIRGRAIPWADNRHDRWPLIQFTVGISRHRSLCRKGEGVKEKGRCGGSVLGKKEKPERVRTGTIDQPYGSAGVRRSRVKKAPGCLIKPARRKTKTPILGPTPQSLERLKQSIHPVRLPSQAARDMSWPRLRAC